MPWAIAKARIQCDFLSNQWAITFSVKLGQRFAYLLWTFTNICAKSERWAKSTLNCVVGAFCKVCTSQAINQNNMNSNDKNQTKLEANEKKTRSIDSFKPLATDFVWLSHMFFFCCRSLLFNHVLWIMNLQRKQQSYWW